MSSLHHVVEPLEAASIHNRSGHAERVVVSVVLPVYNERANLESLHAELMTVLSSIGAAEVVYVDDGSFDGSRELLRELVDRPWPVPIRLVELSQNSGQTAALAAGLSVARGEAIVPMDADGQNNPADIPRLLGRLEEGFDIVSGWRRERKDGFLLRRIPSIVANRLLSRLSGVRLNDYGCSLKAYRAEVLRSVPLYGEMHRFVPVFLAQQGAKVDELVVDHRPRTAGQSKYGTERIPKVMADLANIAFLARYRHRPMHFFGKMALLFFALTALVTAAMVILKWGLLSVVGIDYQATFVETPLPAVAVTFFIGGVLSAYFGMLAELLVNLQHRLGGASSYRIENVRRSQSSSEG